MGSRSRTLKYLAAHELRYAIVAVARDEVSGDVTEAVCLFCRHFGREQRADQKRKAANSVKLFRDSFRPDQYTQHHQLQHPTQWQRYKKCSHEEKKLFFPRNYITKAATTQLSTEPPLKEILIPKAEERGRCFDLKAPILEIVAVLAVGVGSVNSTVETKDRRYYRYMLNHDLKVDNSTSCPRWSPPPETFQSCQLVQMKPPVYRVVVYSKQQMDMLMEMAAQGLSSAQISRVLKVLRARANTLLKDVVGHATKSLPRAKRDVNVAVEQAAERVRGTNLPRVLTPEYNEPQTAELVRLGVAVSMSIVAGLMEDSWAFSLELSTIAQHSLYSYLDVRIKFYNRVSGLCNAHLLAIPKYMANSDIMMFKTLERVLTAVLPDWRKRLIGITTGGDLLIPTRVNDLADQFQDAVFGPVLHRTSHCTNQLQHILNTFYASIDDGRFLLTLKALSKFVRNEPMILSEIKRYPDYKELRDSDIHVYFSIPTAFGQEVDMIMLHSTLIQGHFKQTESFPEPPVSWWLKLEILQWLTTRSNAVFSALEKQHVTILQQGTIIATLAEECITGLRAQIQKEKSTGPSGTTNEFLSDDGRVVLSKNGVLEFVTESSALVRDLVRQGGAGTVHATTEHLASGAANLIASLVELSIYLRQQYGACTTSSNGSRTVAVTEILPPVLPQELARLSPTEFLELVQVHNVTLRGVLNHADIGLIREEHQLLCRSLEEEEGFQNAMKKCIQDSPFGVAWGLTNGRFKRLEAFAGGLATVRPSDAIKLSEASVGDLVLCPKDMEEARLLFADFELESVLHAQQFQPLIKLQEEIYDLQIEERRGRKRLKISDKLDQCS